MSYLPFSPAQSLLWAKLIALTASWTIVAYACFVIYFVKTKSRWIIFVGYTYVLALAVLIFLGFINQRFVPLGNGFMVRNYGYWLYVMTAGGFLFIGYSVYLLIKYYRLSTNPEYRNRITYLLAGIGFLVIFGLIYEAVPTQKFSVDHIGHLANALLIYYAIIRYHLLDMKLVVKKSVLYTSISIFFTALLSFFFFVVPEIFLRKYSSAVTGIATVAALLVLATLFKRLQSIMERGIDRLFYGKTYNYRQMLLNFSSRMNNVINLKEIIDALLKPVANALQSKQVNILFANNECFTTRFGERLVSSDPVIPISLPLKGQVVTWLERESQPLTLDTINFDPEFKGMWQEEIDAINNAEVELLCPVKSKQKLIAILAISKKVPRGMFSRDDIDFLMTLANEAAVVIENAELYMQFKERADIDELTGLSNHRFFHQRLDEEISLCSRFGQIFSLLFVDLDYFKNYNDIFGHLAGDEILKQIGQIIKRSIRDVDISSRYGGDEFAVLLPHTALEDALVVANRLRKNIEGNVDLPGMPITCSIGLASWPADGMLREEIIQAADNALYHAKRNGRNQVSRASEAALVKVSRTNSSGNGGEGSTAIINTIYALAATVDAKDHYTYGHSKKVRQYAMDIAAAMDYKHEEIERISAAALLHDIGKIGVNDRVLKKSDSLTSDEWKLVRAHPELGVSIIKHVDELKGCLAAVLYHHERYDGTGYPAGLNGKNIPLDARIMAVADAFDAMTSDRPYRKRMTNEAALTELQQCAGKQFDPEIVKIFVNLREHIAQKQIDADKIYSMSK
jgi:diguanylate cyclase (GGDEF)-like protein